jgi:hypothetical protein
VVAITAGVLEVASATALADGSSLAVGQGASSLFAPAIAGVAVAAPVSGSPALAAVPEPGTLTLLAVAGLAAIAWRRRRN